MALLCLLLLESWPVAYAQQLLESLDTYDVVRYEVTAEPGERGVAVACELTVLVKRPGPLRFFLSSDVQGLDAGNVAASLTELPLEKVLKAFAPGVENVPTLLTLAPDPPPRAGETVTFSLSYRWAPSGAGLAYAGPEGVQTHLAPFWLPSMAGELFDAVVTVRTDADALAPGTREKIDGGWRFRSAHPLQTIPLVVGTFQSRKRGTLEVLLPQGVDADADALLDDLALVLGKLEDWYGPGPDRFRLAVEPRPRPAPSYCGGSFVVVHRSFLPGSAGRARWLSHLAHECAHVWWGHSVASPVVGRGGTWLREGLAEWSGIRVAGAVLGKETEEALFRNSFRGYVGRIDLRRGAGFLFANEATLLDATYLDEPEVAYLRGALVYRLLAARMGEEAFLERLGAFVRDSAGRFVTAEDFARAVGEAEAIAYYAGTTRLPDLEVAAVEAGRAEVRCRDPLWPGGTVPCLVETEAGPAIVPVEVKDGSGTLRWTGKAKRIEIDPERITLDPIRSNNQWLPPR